MPGNFTLLVSIVFFAAMSVRAAVYARKRMQANFSDPIVLFLACFALFVLPFSLRAYVTTQPEGDVTEHLDSLLFHLPWAVFLCGSSIPVFVWGYCRPATHRLAARLPRPRTGKHARSAFVVLTAISVLLLVQLARSAGGLLDFVFLGYGATSEMFGKGYLAIGFPWLQVASLFLLYRYSVARKISDLVLFGGASAVHIALNLAIGQRAPILYFALATWLFWHHAIGPVPVKKLAALGACAFLALNVVGTLRGSNYTSFEDFWGRTSDSYSSLNDSNDRFFYTVTMGEFVVPFETLPQMMSSVGSRINPQFGLTYLRAPLLWIPSALFPSRPLPLANWYMQEFYGGGLGLNEGRAFFFLSEGYLNFGAIGVLATMLGWGVFLGTCHRYIQRSGHEPGAALLYALAVAFIFRGIAGDFAAMIVALPEQALSAAVIGLWITNRGARDANREAMERAGASGEPSCA